VFFSFQQQFLGELRQKREREVRSKTQIPCGFSMETLATALTIMEKKSWPEGTLESAAR
jgi:hypothetical protein